MGYPNEVGNELILMAADLQKRGTNPGVAAFLRDRGNALLRYSQDADAAEILYDLSRERQNISRPVDAEWIAEHYIERAEEWVASRASPHGEQERDIDRRCGSAGIDADGYCERCGSLVDPNLDEDRPECPPGFFARSPHGEQEQER